MSLQSSTSQSTGHGEGTVTGSGPPCTRLAPGAEAVGKSQRTVGRWAGGVISQEGFPNESAAYPADLNIFLPRAHSPYRTGHLLLPRGRPFGPLSWGGGGGLKWSVTSCPQATAHTLTPPLPCLYPSRPEVVNQAWCWPPGNTGQWPHRASCHDCGGCIPSTPGGCSTLYDEPGVSQPQVPSVATGGPPRTQGPLMWPASLVTCLGAAHGPRPGPFARGSPALEDGLAHGRCSVSRQTAALRMSLPCRPSPRRRRAVT